MVCYSKKELIMLPTRTKQDLYAAQILYEGLVMLPLDADQKKLCHEYVHDYSINAAAKRCGIERKEALNILNRPDAKTYLLGIKTGQNARLMVSADRTVMEMAAIAYLDPVEALHWATADSVEEIPQHVRKAIKTITPRQKPITDADGEVTGYEPNGYVLEFYDKPKALESLMKHTGAYEADNTQKTPNTQISLTDDQLRTTLIAAGYKDAPSAIDELDYIDVDAEEEQDMSWAD